MNKVESKRFVLQSSTWTGDSVKTLEQFLIDNKVRYESYPLKGDVWEIRYKGPYLGPFSKFGFDCKEY